MQRIKDYNIILIAYVFLLLVISCRKTEQNSTTTYIDRIAQDSTFRMGKWYSVTPPTNQSVSPYLDTIWFINDTLAGWSAFVPNNPYAYAFRKTYFPDPLHIAFLAPASAGQQAGTIDTVINQCQMASPTSDTFVIWWADGAFNLTEQRYVKKTN